MYLPVILLFLLVFLLLVQKRRWNKGLVLSIAYIASLLAAFSAYLLYLGQSNFYFYVIHQYFDVPYSLWNKIMSQPLQRDTLLRILTVACSSFVFTAFLFPMVHLRNGRDFAKPWVRRLTICLAAFCLLQIVVYDPWVYSTFYLYTLDRLLGARAIETTAALLSFLFRAGNLMALLGGVAIALFTAARTRSIRVLKSYTVFLSFCHSILVVVYILLLSWWPSFLVKTSKLTGYRIYQPIPLQEDPTPYRYYSYLIVLFTVVLAVVLAGHARLLIKLQSKNMGINREINTAALTTSVFSHYIKNEMLAIMAELEDSQDPDGSGSLAVHRAMERCTEIYDRLDKLRLSPKSIRLSLQRHELGEPIRKALRNLEGLLEETGTQTVFDDSKAGLSVLMDSFYMTEVVQNIVLNAVEARREDAPCLIRIWVEYSGTWAVINISDNGKGIEKEHLGKIFNPYFSTKPSKRNWGVGLALCYRIVSSHEGRLEVESKPGEGTVFKVAVPVYQ